MSDQQPYALRVTGAAKTFGTVRVLHGVDLSLRPGELRALVGENGSGKSTLVKLLAGYHLPDPGTRFEVGGVQIEPHRPEAGERAGLRFVHQELGLVSGLTAVENFGLGRGYGSRPGHPVRWRERKEETRSAIAELGYDFDVDRLVGSLSASERTAVVVARAIAPHRGQTRVLVLDEPTANLPGAEVDRLFQLIRRVCEAGIAVLFVSHHLNEVFETADTVTVLRGGHHVTTQTTDGLDEDALIELMVGHHVQRSSATRLEAEDREAVLEARGLSGGSVREVDISVAAGEIVGVAGITGSGREAIAGLLYGAQPRTGSVTVSGRPIRPARPDQSLAAGMALVPAERAANAVLPGHDVRENLTIGRQPDFRRWFGLSKAAETATAQQWLEDLDIRPRSTALPMSVLSGGNAQKVILARWLRLNPRVLLLDEPTQGVDVGAKEDIHRRIEQAASSGCAVLVASNDNEELARICDRTLVMTRGRVTDELAAGFHPDTLTTACLRDARGTES